MLLEKLIRENIQSDNCCARVRIFRQQCRHFVKRTGHCETVGHRPRADEWRRQVESPSMPISDARYHSAICTNHFCVTLQLVRICETASCNAAYFAAGIDWRCE